MNHLYQKIPKVDQLLARPAMRALAERYGSGALLFCARRALDDLRERIRQFAGSLQEAGPQIESGKDASDSDELRRIETCCDPAVLEKEIELALEADFEPVMRRVINATGVVLHTNLGRAPLMPEAAEDAARMALGYVNLEYDLKSGERGRRGGRCEELLARLSGAEDALVVNNNAAAVLFVLNCFCKNKEVIVSRGELVEIGGQFRIPEVMEAGSAILREVGSTNKTREDDYLQAIESETAAIMKVHTSNYRIIGFTEEVEARELAKIAAEHGLILIEDLGSGALLDMEQFAGERTVPACVASGADLVLFSADKLLGGPQAGIIAGRADLIARLRSHPMMRAFRVDKMTAAALERTLTEYLNPDRARRTIPVLAMIGAGEEELLEKAERLADLLRAGLSESYDISVEGCEDRIGGGTLPTETFCGSAVRIHGQMPAGKGLMAALRALRFPIVCRCDKGDMLLSVRTVCDSDFELIADELTEVLL